jgi:hypothetical protein
MISCGYSKMAESDGVREIDFHLPFYKYIVNKLRDT